MKPIIYFILLLLIHSCAFHSGSLNSSIPPVPVVHKDLAIGVSKTTKFIGMGGVLRDVIVFDARQNIISNRPLTGNESYNNVSTDVKSFYFLFVTRTKVTMIADVIAPKDSINQPSYSVLYEKKVMKSYNTKDSLFHVGDSVLTYHGKNGVIINFEGVKNKKARVRLNDAGHIRTCAIPLRKLFTKIPRYNGFDLGFHSRYGIYVAFGSEGALAFDGTIYIIDFYKENNKH